MRRLFDDKIKQWTSGKKAYEVSLEETKKKEEPKEETKAQVRWNVAKELLSRKLFPETLDFGKGVQLGATHSEGRGEHSLTNFKRRTNSIEGFEVEAIYNICPKCNGEVRNKYLVMFNDALGVCCQKRFVKRGEVV